jgi:hypothetical protein
MIESALHQAHGHQPVKFPLNRAPIDVADWPHWETFINRDRLYEFYAKQAEFFRVHEPRPTLLGEFPGLDGGPFGHWGNQNEASWANDNWNNTDLGSVLGGVFNGPNGPINARRCVWHLGDTQEYGVCVSDPDTLTYEAFWKGGFLSFLSDSTWLYQWLDSERGVPRISQRAKSPISHLSTWVIIVTGQEDRVCVSHR